jgi:hypothetical protein
MSMARGRRSLMPRQSAEQTLHRHVADLLRLVLPASVLATTFPAGGGGRVRGRVLKGMGLVPGMPDWLIAHGGKTLWIELKSPIGRLSPEQKAVHERLRQAGHFVEIGRSIDDVIDALDRHGIPHRISTVGHLYA